MKRRYLRKVIISIILSTSLSVLFLLNNHNVSANSNLRSINAQSIKNMIAHNKTFKLYIGRSTCNSCRNFQIKLKKYLKMKKKNYHQIYYFNTDFKGYKMFKTRKFYNHLGVKFIPSVLNIVKGKVLITLSGTNDWNKIIKLLK